MIRTARTTRRRDGRGRDDGPEANLDDLLRHEDPAPTALAGQSRPGAWLVPAAIQAFAASAVVYTLFHVVNLAPSYPMILAVCAGSVLVRRSVRATAEATLLRTQDVLRPPDGLRGADPDRWREGADGMLDAVRRWDRRLDWGTMFTERFESTVVPRLVEIADERLRQRHGITQASDPERARGLLGEQLWTLLHDEAWRVPSMRDIATAVDALERL